MRIVLIMAVMLMLQIGDAQLCNGDAVAEK
jgi:hypothetical protein